MKGFYFLFFSFYPFNSWALEWILAVNVVIVQQMLLTEPVLNPEHPLSFRWYTRRTEIDVMTLSRAKPINIVQQPVITEKFTSHLLL